MGLNHVLNNAHYSFRALDKFRAKLLVTLPEVSLVEEVVAVGVRDASHDCITNSNYHQRVEHYYVHDRGVGDLRLGV